MCCITTQLKDKNLKPLITFILSFVDIIAGILSLVIDNLWCQILSLVCSTITLLYLFYINLKHKNEIKSRWGAFALSLIDVIFGVLTLLVMQLSVQIVSAVTSGLVAFRISKIAVQSEKVKKLLTTLKPIILKILKYVAPVLMTSIIAKCRKIKTKKKNKGDKKSMKVFKSILNWVKNNKITLSGGLLTLGVDGGCGILLYDWIVSLGVMPEWANIVVTCASCVLFAVIAILAICKKGIESDTEVKLRKAAQLLGVEDVYNKIIPAITDKENEIEAQKLLKQEEQQKAKESKALEKEAKQLLKEQEKQEAKARLAAEAQAEKEKQEAEAKAKEEQLAKAKEEHDRLIAEKIAELKAKKEAETK